MPGTYLEYIKAGRYVVPVELTFLPHKFFGDGRGEGQATTTKWVERRHWKEIKAMLKPAVEVVAKCNESVSDSRIPKSPQIEVGQEVSMGFLILVNKDKCPFAAVLDPKRNCWTDDEGETEVDRNTGMADLGGQHKSFTPTKCYIKACVSKKTPLDDGKRRIRKELGIKLDDLRSFLSPSSGQGVQQPAVPPPTATSSSSYQSGSGSGYGYGGTTSSSGSPFASSPTNEKQHKSRSVVHKEKPIKRKRKEDLLDLPYSIPLEPEPSAEDEETPGGPTRHRSSDEASVDSMIGENLDLSGIIDSADLLSYTESIDEEVFTSSFTSLIEELPDLDNGNRVDSAEWQEANTNTTTNNNNNNSIIKKGKKPIRKKSSHEKEKSPTKAAPATTAPVATTDSPEAPSDEMKRGTTKPKKKQRNVAIVEPMKPMRSTPTPTSGLLLLSSDEALEESSSGSGTDRKKRTRCTTASPTLERLMSSRVVKGASSSAAVEILGQDIRSVSVESGSHIQPSHEKRKRKERAPLVNVEGKRLRVSSPFLESADGNLTPDSDSESEMPVLTKMITTSSDDEMIYAGISGVTPPLSPDSEVPDLEMEVPATATPPVPRSPVKANKVGLSHARCPSPDIAELTASSRSGRPKVRKKKKLAQSKPVVVSIQEDSSDAIAIRPEIEENPPLSPIIRSESHSEKPKVKKKIKAPQDPLLDGNNSGGDVVRPEETVHKKTHKYKKKKKKKNKEPQESSSPSSETLVESIDTLASTRITGHAQTQTGLSPPPPPSDPPVSSTSSALVLYKAAVPSESESDFVVGVNSRALKTERLEKSRNFEGTTASDTDVVFKGRFKPRTPAANLMMIQLDDGDDGEELFSFEKPASIKVEMESINVVKEQEEVEEEEEPYASLELVLRENTPSFVEEEEDEEEEEFEYSYTSLGSTKNSRGSAAVLEVLSGRRTRSPPPPPPQPIEEDSDDDEEPEPEPTPIQKLSTLQLLKHPGTLQGGFGILSRVIAGNNGRNRSAIEKLKRKRDKAKRRNKALMPPPSKRSSSPDICSSGGGKKRGKKRGGSPVPGSSSALEVYRNTDFEDISSEDDDDSLDQVANVPYFREYLSRSLEPEKEYQPKGDEYDLTQSSQCMLNVVQDYADKSRQYKMHKKKIDDLNHEQFTEVLEGVKSQIVGIFEGKVESQRNKLFCSKRQCDRKTLRTLQVTMNEEHGHILNHWLTELLAPNSESALMCGDYINYVMTPETFIRIFSKVNQVNFETAEKEVLFGACYEGPYVPS